MAGTPSIYFPTRLWGGTYLGSLVTLYGSLNAGTQIDDIIVTNVSTGPIGVSMFLGASGYTGNASASAFVYNFSVPSDGLPYSVINKAFVIKPTDNIQALASLATGITTFASGIELQ